MKLIIAGGREFADYELLKKECLAFIGDSKVECVISGMARGADRLGLTFACWMEYEIDKNYPNYEKYPKKIAPLIRNTEMAKKGTHLIAFWDGKSTGTFDMITKSKRQKAHCKNN